MSSAKKKSSIDIDIYSHLTAARNYLRKLDDFYARAAAAHNTTLEHYQVLLAVHCLGEDLTLRVLAEHLVRDRTATGQLCRRMEQLGLLQLTYEVDSHRPQLVVNISQRGRDVLKSVTDDGLKNRDQYLKSLGLEKRLYLAEAVRFSWLEGLEDATASPKSEG
jgi:DNA-binding MarR family transcriptional regulator